MRSAFVTGATGLLGGNLVRELLSRGWRVRAMVRDETRARRLLPNRPELALVRGDLDDVVAFEGALEGVEVMFHTAAYFRESYQGGSHWARLHAVNVVGTRALLDAAYRQGVRRVLHVSSVGTLMAVAPGNRAVDETMRRAPEQTRNDYFRSKILADRVVEEALARHEDLWAAFVLPGFMNGPGDAGPTSAGQTAIDFAAARLPGVIDARFSYVDARDVAYAAVEAVDRAARGARFVVAGKRLHLAEAYEILERVTGAPAPKRRVPMAVLAVVASLNELWARVSGRPVLIGLAIFRTLRDEGPYGLYDSSKAERELGVRFRPVEDTLRDAVEWLAGAGMLRLRDRVATGVALAPRSAARAARPR